LVKQNDADVRPKAFSVKHNQTLKFSNYFDYAQAQGLCKVFE
jgi:hypothetical protein